MIKQILIEYCKANTKYDLIIDKELCGKYYDLESAIKGIEHGIRVFINRKQRLNVPKEQPKDL